MIPETGNLEKWALCVLGFFVSQIITMAAEEGEKLSTFRPLGARETKIAVPGLLKTKIEY